MATRWGTLREITAAATIIIQGTIVLLMAVGSSMDTSALPSLLSADYSIARGAIVW